MFSKLLSKFNESKQIRKKQKTKEMQKMDFTAKPAVYNSDIKEANAIDMEFLIKEHPYIATATKGGGNKKEATRLKKTLPLFFPCVWYSDSGKFHNNEEVVGTGLVQFDIDDILIEKSQTLKDDLIKNCPFLYYTFISPKGGLKFALNTDFKDDNKKTIKRRFQHAYDLTEKELRDSIKSLAGVKVDNACKSITQMCYLAHDPDLYWNENAKKLEINDSVTELYILEKKEQEKRLTKQFKDTRHKSSATEIERALNTIPSVLSYEQRLIINFAVFDGLGYAGTSLLLSHWIVEDRQKLENDLNSQFKSHISSSGKKIAVGTLFYEAKKYGFKPKHRGRNNKSRKEGKEPFYNQQRISVSDSTDTLNEVVDTFFEDKENTIALVEAGLGKTRKVLEHIAKNFDEYKKVKIAYFVPDHSLGDDVISDIRGYSDWSIQASSVNPFRAIKGFGKRCNLLKKMIREVKGKESKLVSIIEDFGFLYSSKVCESCGILEYDHCEYHDQFLNTSSGLRLYSKEYLFHPSGLDFDWKPDFIVIDEDIVGHIIEDSVLQGTDLVKRIIKMAEAKGLKQSLLYHEHEIRKEKNRNSKGLKHTENLKDKMAGYRDRISQLEDRNNLIFLLDWIKYWNKKKEQGNTLNTIEGMDSVTNESPSHKVELQEYKNSEGKTIKYLAIRSLKVIDQKWEGIPILYLDATGVQPIIEKATGITFTNSHKIKTQYNENIEVQMISNALVSKSWLSERKNRDKLEQFLRIINNDKTGYTTYKNLGTEAYAEYLIKNGIAMSEQVLWYGNLRGSNLFSTEDLNQQIQIGRHSIPSTALKLKHQLIFDLEEQVEGETQVIDWTVPMKDGEHLTIENFCYCNPELQAMSEHFDKGESCQAGHRLRLLHGNQRKRLLMLSNEALDYEYTRVWDSDALFVEIDGPRAKVAEIVKQKKVVNAKNKFLTEETECSESQIKKMKVSKNSDGEKWIDNNPFFDHTQVKTKKIGKTKAIKNMSFFTVWDLEKSELKEILHNDFGVELIEITDCSNKWQLDYWKRSTTS